MKEKKLLQLKLRNRENLINDIVDYLNSNGLNLVVEWVNTRLEEDKEIEEIEEEEGYDCEFE